MTIPPGVRFLSAYLVPYRMLLALAMLGLVVAAATDPVHVWLVKTAVDWDPAAQGRLRYWMLPCIVVLIYLVKGVAVAGSAWLMGKVCAGVIHDLRLGLFDNFLGQRDGMAADVHAGKIVHLMVFEIKQCSDLVERVFTKLIKHVLSLLTLFAYLLYENRQLGLVSLIVLPGFVWVCMLLGRQIVPLAQRQIRLNEELAQRAIDGAALARLMKLHGHQGRAQASFDHAARRLRRHTLRLYTLTALAAPVTQAAAALVFGLLIFFALALAAQGRATAGQAAGFVTNLLLLLGPLKNIAELNGPLLRSIAGIDAILGFFGPAAAPAPRPRAHAADPGASVQLRQVSYRHPRAERALLSGVDFCVAPGEIVAIVGASGSGKTTLFELLQGNLAPEAGEIVLGSVPLAQLADADIRSRVAAMDQCVLMRDESIAANVAYGDAAPDMARVANALELAQLSEFVATLPLGVHSPVGLGARQLSGGQRQQLAIARALYRNAPVFLFDEGTSALDGKVERMLCSVLRNIRHKTILMITHRLASIEMADRVLWLKDGTIAAAGRHADLMQTDSAYRQFLEGAGTVLI